MDILYRDPELVVCIKPAGVISEEPGMPALLREAFGGGSFYCVHRLDRETAGLMVYARSAAAAAALSDAIVKGAFHKEYLAVVQGFPPEAGELRDLLYHDRTKNRSYVVKRQRKGVREAVLRYRVLLRGEERSLLRVELLTGRSHQIRVQFASRGFPLLGDGRYGSPLRQPLALWCASLRFPHPSGGELLRFSAPPPWPEYPPALLH